jgi:hypothetical protein
MNEVPRAVEGEAVLRKRPAQSAYRRLALKENRIVVQQVKRGADSGEPAADNDTPSS